MPKNATKAHAGPTTPIALAARARKYARRQCPKWAKGWPMQACVQRYALRVLARPCLAHMHAVAQQLTG